MLSIYPSETRGESRTLYYEDDGVSFHYLTGEYLKRTITQTLEENRTTLTLSACEGSYIPPKRSLRIQFVAAVSSPRSVQIEGEKLQRFESNRLKDVRIGWAFDAAAKVIWVKCEDFRSTQHMVLTYQGGQK